ncbi:MAG TPA: MBL fold metallo-hydrolase [Thermodesulfovibrionales bacterium]|nr:MBL fold metallo-hydrolase [Thermodesulfovibrionales bacterium]
MMAISLQSGSNGNCLYVEANGKRLLFDAGICGIKAEQRLAAYGKEIRDVDALIISHDHADHICYAGVYQRKYGIPIYVSAATLEAALSRRKLGELRDLRYFRNGDRITFGRVSVQTIPTRHDGADGAAFVISSGRERIGILTDLGHVFKGLGEVVSTLDGVFIESNYDPDMLAQGPYPAFLKKRIQGPGGHLSNIEAAELLGTYGVRLKWACLAHLSEQNNHPALALRTHRSITRRRYVLHVASRCSATSACASGPSPRCLQPMLF